MYMTDVRELSTVQLRANLAEVINAAAVRSEPTYITNRGRRVAAIVPAPVVEQAVGDQR